MKKMKEPVVFSVFDNFAVGNNKIMEWSRFAASAVKSVGYDTKEESIRRKAIIGGPLVRNGKSREGNVVERTMLTLDFDKVPPGVDTDDIELALPDDMALLAYTTFRHTDETPRVRILIPLSRPVSDDEHRALVDHVVGTMMDKDVFGPPDECSVVLNQLMFLASHTNGVEPWSFVTDDGTHRLDVDALGIDWGGVTRGEGDGEGDDDDFGLDAALADQPLDFTDAQIDRALAALPAEGCDYDQWKQVGMALWHQFRGSDEGFEKWDAWSEMDQGRYDAGSMPGKWKSFDHTGRRGARPVTMATVVKAAGGVAVLEMGAESEDALRLKDQAKGVSDERAYDELKHRMRNLSITELSADKREMYAKLVHDAWAKGAGMGIGAVRKALAPRGRKDGVTVVAGSVDCPAWLDGWVYVDGRNYFVNPTSAGREMLDKQGFNARFDRLVPGSGSGDGGDLDDDQRRSASEFALHDVQIDTVYDEMFWPGGGQVLERKGVKFANSYRDGRAQPLDADDPLLADGEAGALAIEAFKAHLRRIIPSRRERRLLVDFMKFVYCEEGRRVGWAVLLYGTQGNGKTYINNVMTALLGTENSQVVAGSTITGRFTNWGEGRVLNSIEEVRVEGKEKWAAMDKMKQFITNKEIDIEAKGVNSIKVPNFTSYLLFSNHADAIPVARGDRRYMVIETAQVTPEHMLRDFGDEDAQADYFDQLFGWLYFRGDVGQEAGDVGAAALARFLVDHEYSAEFRPEGKAPWTEARDAMQSFHVNEGDEQLEDALERFEGPYINELVIDVTLLQHSAEMEGMELPKTRSLSHKLVDMGYKRSSERVRTRGFLRTFWFRSGEVTLGKARDLVTGEGVGGYVRFEDGS